jgi:mono/diheme cytochrome c family protein
MANTSRTRRRKNMRTRRILGTVLLVFLLVPGLALAGGDSAKGKQVYKQYCVSCHGPNGKGDGQAAAALKPKPRDFTDKSLMGSLTDDYMVKVIQGGGASVGKSPMMPPWGGALKQKAIEDVIAFIRHFSQ